jgi:hypothetical protein
MEIRRVVLEGVDPEVKRLAKQASTWMASPAGKKAVQEIAKRAQAAEDEMREAQKVDAKPLSGFSL